MDLFFVFCKMNSLKIEFGLNPVSAQVVQVIKVDFISPDIVRTEIDKNLKFNYPNYSSFTLFELPFHRNFKSLTSNFSILCSKSIIKEKFKIPI